jgi:CO/xanthine dehydrogenase Mo-binding subunit
MGPVTAAIGNAIFSALGVRLRNLPFNRENILKAIEAR